MFLKILLTIKLSIQEVIYSVPKELILEQIEDKTLSKLILRKMSSMFSYVFLCKKIALFQR